MIPVVREPLPPDRRLELLAAGQAAVNRGDFYEAHEHWEEVWLQEDDPQHTWIQGLIQVATGLHKLHQGHAQASTRLFERALAKLGDAPPSLDGVDVDGARRIATRMLEGLRKGDLPDPTGVKLGA
jgi:predicted metal-dependent hydrolase